MPADITGTEILDEEGGHRALRFLKGPIFAQIILADEINRTPPKTQAALLEAMQEYHVTAAGRTYELERPFFVLATQNPIELEGTYPLPEAQLDRFMFNVVMTYLVAGGRSARRDADDRRGAHAARSRARRRATSWRFRRACAKCWWPTKSRATRCAWSTARGRAAAPSSSSCRSGSSGAPGLRASQALILGSKARALMHGRHHVSVKDIQALAKPILRHRVIPNFYAEAEGITADRIIEQLLEAVPAPASGL